MLQNYFEQLFVKEKEKEKDKDKDNININKKINIIKNKYNKNKTYEKNIII